ncbi:MAG: class I SAM-dependent methyltransferase [Pseudomonadales bacterium]|nr:class I SAM-dependent methyltransferase [Pseudomonadales bacterium]
MCLSLPGYGISKSDLQALHQSIKAEHREARNTKRDQYRHPKAVLRFFDVQPQMTIVEIWPSTGWWTEILGPYTHGIGHYYAAGFAMTAERTPQWRKKMQINFANKLAARPKLYGHIVSTELSVPQRVVIAPPASADRVLTFRNVHNWMKGDYAQAMFNVMYVALKPGGVLGLVEHRAKPGTSLADMINSGYVTEAYIKELSLKAGFQFDQSSELNANGKDSTLHPKGVWTLPPSLRLCKTFEDKAHQQCVEKYRALGESDRMTLRFIKP